MILNVFKTNGQPASVNLLIDAIMPDEQPGMPLIKTQLINQSHLKSIH